MEKMEQESAIRKMARLDGDSAFDIKAFESIEKYIQWMRAESIVNNTRARIRLELDLLPDETELLDYFQLYFEYHAIGWFEAHLQNLESGHYSREPQIQIDTTDYDIDMTKPELPATPIDAYYETLLKTKVDYQHILKNLREAAKHIENMVDGIDDTLKKIRKVREIESE